MTIKKINRKRRGQRGSFLVEVLLTVVILAVGLTLIIQSLMSSLRASVYSYGYSTALLLLENKLFDVFASSSEPSFGQEKGRFDKPYEQYEYVLDVDDAQEMENMNDINLRVTWNSGGKEKRVSVDTYQYQATQ